MEDTPQNDDADLEPEQAAEQSRASGRCDRLPLQVSRSGGVTSTDAVTNGKRRRE